jgi:hypothetical protein
MAYFQGLKVLPARAVRTASATEIFRRQNEAPRVGLEPTTLRFQSGRAGEAAATSKRRRKRRLGRMLCQLSYRKNDNSPGWTRTNNPPVNSRMLCQLSYRGTVLGGREL